MRRVYVCTISEPPKGARERPSICGIAIGDKIIIKELFRSGEGKIVGDISDRIDEVRKIIVAATSKGAEIVLSDFKAHIRTFKLPLNLPYKVYDLHLPDIKPGKSKHADILAVRRVLEKMQTQKVHDYQRLISDAAIVYEDLQRAGLMVGLDKVRPIYSQRTFSGRSKTTGYNIQGLSEEFPVWSPRFPESDILIHFDWICADIRVASLLANDTKLSAAFQKSDPYTMMMEEINKDSSDQITRDEVKLFLLKSINSMDFHSEALSDIYSGLGEWIMKCKSRLDGPSASLQTILGRKFRLVHAKNQLAVLNGVMQGSVAHAMQRVVRKIWDEIGTRLITEIHDSLVVSSPRDKIDDTVDLVAGTMFHPFQGLLEDNPSFPVKVSVGKKWKKWKLLRVYR